MPRSMQQHPDALLAKAHELRDLGARPSFELEEHEYFAVALIEAVECAVQKSALLSLFERLGGKWPWVFPFRSCGDQAKKPRPNLLATPVVAHRVEGDAVEPGAHRCLV